MRYIITYLAILLLMTYRSPVKVILLSIFTAGIYILYWLYATSQEMKRQHIALPRWRVFGLPFLASVGLILLTSLISLPLDRSGSAYHFVNLVMFPILGLAFIFAIVPIIVWWFWRYCAGVQLATNGRLSQSTSFLLLCVLSFFGAGVVWPMIVQNYFNSERTT